MWLYFQERKVNFFGKNTSSSYLFFFFCFKCLFFYKILKIEMYFKMFYFYKVEKKRQLKAHFFGGFFFFLVFVSLFILKRLSVETKFENKIINSKQI